METGWKIETRKGRIEGGGSYEDTEKVKEISRENGKRTIEAIVLNDIDIDSGGNKSIDTHKGYHYVSLLEGKKQLSFAIDFTKSRLKGWRVLSDDCRTFVKDVKTKKEAITLLPKAARIESA